jgi:hypothetical protein
MHEREWCKGIRALTDATLVFKVFRVLAFLKKINKWVRRGCNRVKLTRENTNLTVHKRVDPITIQTH